MKSWIDEQAGSLQDSIKRYQNQDFLDGVVAGCALVAAADGEINATEKQKMVGFIQRSQELKVFDIADVIKSFNRISESFEFDYQIGKAEAFKAIGKMRGDTEAARLLVRVCCAIGMADGEFDDAEKGIITEVCQELTLDPSEFF
ncbi:tellurite resistance TerB family protein [Magnetococcales bacterium HHB-1]